MIIHATVKRVQPARALRRLAYSIARTRPRNQATARRVVESITATTSNICHDNRDAATCYLTIGAGVWADKINAIFETVAACLAWRGVAVLVRDRAVKGIFWPQVAWSGVWALWCLPYYLSVGHTFSFAASCVRELATLTWLALLWRYRA